MPGGRAGQTPAVRARAHRLSTPPRSEGPRGPTCGEDGDVHDARPRVGRRLLQGLSVQALGLLHVDRLHLVGKAHLSVGFGQAGQRFQLSGVRGHHPSAAADLPHVHVSLARQGTRRLLTQ